MGLLGGLFKTAVNAVMIPVAIVSDAVELVVDGEAGDSTSNQIDKTIDSMEDTFDGDFL